MNRILLTAGVMAVLVYAMVLGVKWLSPKIEDDIANRIASQLAQNGQLWADATVKGREVTLTGEAPDSDAKAAVLADMSKVFGIAKVHDNMTVVGETSGTTVDRDETATLTKAEKQKLKLDMAAKAKAEADYALVIEKDGDRVTISGTVPSESDKDLLQRLATTHYGAGNTDLSQLQVAEGAPAGWRVAAGSVLFNMVNLEKATATLSGREVMVSGTVLDQQFSMQMEEAIKLALPKNYKIAFAVEEAPVTVPAAEVDAEPSVAVAEVTPTEVKIDQAAEAKTISPAGTNDTEVKPAQPTDEPTLAAVEPAAGCDISKAKLHFDFDKAELRAADAPVIASVAATLTACEDMKAVTVAGYTDVTGSKLYNKWLSQQRAEAGMRGLMRAGVAKDRLQAVGYGEKDPVASNKTRAGRAQNRRVEFHSSAAQ
jgi:outer membrane protein OmpA-like peptidoglycan-associated protein/osmotically-inducible protein OsmY